MNSPDDSAPSSPSNVTQFDTGVSNYRIVPADVVAVPGYLIERELGRGGMGVVYQARQVVLNRTVALKMILAGSHAGAAELQRFRTEAEALARLQHPNIVQIHEVGEQQGLPYFALEYCAGGSLEHKLNGTPLLPMEAVRLVETLARAIQAAHDRGVIHRDLSPGNVLFDAEGMPKIADFGLAKRLDEATRTSSGAIMGTPSYMAPEQAAGKNTDVGPVSDVYALGAILYECLTGRAPFKAATALDTLLQVMADEPVAPRSINGQVHQDINIICLKCLHKVPHQRYQSAAALAEDLARFQRGESIQARPEGTPARFVRWCRRNPLVAALTAGVVAALLLGVLATSSFGIEAWQQTEEARRTEAAAQAQAQEADRERDAALAARSELERTNDRLKANVARSLVRPLAVQHSSAMLSEPEVEAMWELAATSDEDLRRRFVLSALANSGSIVQLATRAEFATHATVGLNRERRQWLNTELTAKLHALPATGEKLLVAQALAANQGIDRPLARELVPLLFAKLQRPASDVEIRSSIQWLVDIAPLLEPEESLSVLARAANSIVTLFPNNLADITQLLASSVFTVDSRVQARLAAALATAFTTCIEKRIASSNIYGETRALTGIGDKLEARDARPIVERLSRLLQPTQDPFRRWYLATVLVASATPLEPKEKATLCQRSIVALTEAMAKSSNAADMAPLAKGVATLAAGLDAHDATVACHAALTHLNRVMNTASDTIYTDTGGAVVALAEYLEPRTVAVTLLRFKRMDQHFLFVIRLQLPRLAAWLEPHEAAEMATRMVPMLRQVQVRNFSHMKHEVVRIVAALAARLEPGTAAPLVAMMFPVLTSVRPEDAELLSVFGQCLSALAAKLTPAEVPPLLELAMKDVGKLTSPLQLWARAECLSALAVALNPLEARRACRQLSLLLLESVAKTPSTRELWYLAQTLAVVAKWIALEDMAPILKRLTTVLTQSNRDSEPKESVQDLVRGVRGLAPHLASAEAAQLAEVLLHLLTKHTDHVTITEIATGLTTLSSRLDARQGIRIRLRAVHLFTTQCRLNYVRGTFYFPPGFLTLLTGEAPADFEKRRYNWVGMIPVLHGSSGPLMLPALLQLADCPRTPLPAQALVDLLAHPLCVGPQRIMVLAQLQRHYQRPFAERWDFIQFAQENKLELDLTRPPQRILPRGKP